MRGSLRLRVALVHDDLVQWGGAERMLKVLSEIFPAAPIYTSVYDSENDLLRQAFSDKKIITSFMQKIPSWKNMYKLLLPLYPIAFEQFNFDEYDLVISQTTRFAKSVITKPNTTHICYCHTPPRFLWGFSGEQSSKWLQPFLSLLRTYDQYSARRVDKWIAGSYNAQQRIQKVYRQSSEVIQPCLGDAVINLEEKFDGGYLLVVSRLTGYKRIDIAIKVAKKLKLPLKIVGTGPDRYDLEKMADSSVEFLGRVDDYLLKLLLSGCKALLVCAEEDFGLTALEAQSMGKPVVAYNKGGSRETVLDGKTGYLYEEQSVDSLIEALNKLLSEGYNEKACIEQSSRFSKLKFIEQFEKSARRVVES